MVWNGAGSQTHSFMASCFSIAHREVSEELSRCLCFLCCSARLCGSTHAQPRTLQKSRRRCLEAGWCCCVPCRAVPLHCAPHRDLPPLLPLLSLPVVKRGKSAGLLPQAGLHRPLRRIQGKRISNIKFGQWQAFCFLFITNCQTQTCNMRCST